MTNFSQLDDLQLINYIKTNEAAASDCLVELHNRHTGIVYSAVNNYSAMLRNSGVAPESIKSLSYNLVLESALSYDPERKTQYTTWLFDRTKYACLNQSKKSRLEVATDDETIEYLIHSNTEEDPNDDNKLDCIDKAKDYINNLQDEKIKLIFQYRYFESKEYDKKYTWREIAEKVGMEAPYVYYLHNYHLQILKKRLS